METRSLEKPGTARRLIHTVVNSWKWVIALYVAAVLLSALAFSIAESRSYGQSLWWAFITALTIGYGDIFPVTTAGRVTGVILAHFVVLVVAPVVIAHLTLRLVEDKDAFTDREQRELMSGQDELRRRVKALLDHLDVPDTSATQPDDDIR